MNYEFAKNLFSQQDKLQMKSPDILLYIILFLSIMLGAMVHFLYLSGYIHPDRMPSSFNTIVFFYVLAALSLIGIIYRYHKLQTSTKLMFQKYGVNALDKVSLKDISQAILFHQFANSPETLTLWIKQETDAYFGGKEATYQEVLTSSSGYFLERMTMRIFRDADIYMKIHKVQSKFPTSDN